MKTSKYGYMIRKLVDCCTRSYCYRRQCYTTKDVEVSAIIDTFENVVIDSYMTVL